MSTRARREPEARGGAGPQSASPDGPALEEAPQRPGGFGPEAALWMQRTVGNRATGGLLQRRGRVQAKLIVGAASSPDEREADAVADQATRAPGERVALSRGPLSSDAGFAVPPDVEDRILDRRGAGEPLPFAVQEPMERSLGAHLGGVRLHKDKEAVELNRRLGARAFTHGSDIFFGEGGYDLSSQEGHHRLVHELAHVIQQGGASHVVQREPLPSRPDSTPLPDLSKPSAIPASPASERRAKDDPWLLQTIYTSRFEKLIDALVLIRNAKLKREVDAKTKKQKQAEGEIAAYRAELEKKYPAPVKGDSDDVIKSRHNDLVKLTKETLESEGDRYSPALRSVLLDFAGIRYLDVGAATSYRSAKDFLELLGRESVGGTVASKTTEDVSKESEAIRDKLSPEQRKVNSGLGAVSERLAAIPDKDPDKKKSQQDAYHRLITLQTEELSLRKEMASPSEGADKSAVAAKLAEIKAQIKAEEGALGPALLTQLRAAEKTQRAALLKYLREQTSQQIAALSEPQAVHVLEAMKDNLPAWVWSKLVELTPLRLENGQGTWWNKSAAERSKAGNTKDPAVKAATKSWDDLIATWLQKREAWQGIPDADLADYITTIVCNEIVGLYRKRSGTGGYDSIKGHQQSYQGKPGKTFKLVKAEADLKPGASLFFAQWKGERQEAHLVQYSADLELFTHDERAKLANESDHDAAVRRSKRLSARIAAGPSDDGWTYSLGDRGISRNQGARTEWLSWKHIAVVAGVSDLLDGKWLILLEGDAYDSDLYGNPGATRRGTGLNRRARVDEIINQWNVFVGY